MWTDIKITVFSGNYILEQFLDKLQLVGISPLQKFHDKKCWKTSKYYTPKSHLIWTTDWWSSRPSRLDQRECMPLSSSRWWWMECVWHSGNAARLVFMSAYFTALQPSLTHSGSLSLCPWPSLIYTEPEYKYTHILNHFCWFLISFSFYVLSVIIFLAALCTTLRQILKSCCSVSVLITPRSILPQTFFILYWDKLKKLCRPNFTTWWGFTVMCEQNRCGLSTQPWGTPVWSTGV